MRSAEIIKNSKPAGQSHRRPDTAAFPHGRVKSIALCVAAALAAYPYINASAQDLPTNPQVVGGAASVTQSGNTQTVTQTTNRAIINWGSFSIGADNSVNFIQPGASSVVLNRVVGNDPSSIFGSLSANGKVFLVNPNGIFFGAGSSVDTGGLVATTMSIRDNDFMSGYFNFERSGAGQVENAGLITIREGGYALLAADQVANTSTGVINAPKGSVMLASAERVTIDTNQDGLVGFSVSGDAIREVASVDNAGLISADGGRIMLSARGTQELTGMVVNNSGTIRAQTVDEQDGAIILSGSSGVTQSSGVLDASGSRGGNIQVTNEQGVAAVSGQLIATGSEDAGGRIVVAGQQTGLFANTNIDVSGTQGGTVRVGGEYRGDAVEGITSQQTYVASSANIKADGMAGDGGSVVVWADDVTRYDGSISARGTGTGRGGDAEVSGKEILAFNGTADLRAESGQFGSLLLDPATITIIDAAQPATPTAPAELDGNLPTILAGQFAGEDSTIASGTLEGLAANANVTLEATGLIRMNDLADNVLNMQQNNSGSLTLRSTTSGGIVFDDKDDRIQTNGGNITLQAQGSGSIDIGSLTSNGGAINLSSAGATTTRNLSSSGGAININSGAGLTTGALTSANGAIDLDSAGNMTIGNVNAGTAGADLRSGAQLSVGSVVGGVVALNSTGNLSTSGAVTSSSNATIRSSNGTATIGGNVSATRVDGGTATVDISSRNNLIINNAVTAQSNTGKATVRLTSDNGGITLNQNVLAQGGAAAGNEAALVAITARNAINQAGGSIRAVDTAAAQFNPNNEAHFASVNINSSNDSVSLRDVQATAAGGRAQVDVEGRNGITVVSGGSITTTAAAQPGINMTSTHGNINTNGATLRVTQTEETQVTVAGTTSFTNPNKVVKDVGGISIEGGTLNLGWIESNSTAASGIALFGIATTSRGDTTFSRLVNTNSDAGISVATSGDGVIRTLNTAGNSGLLRTKALSLSGDRDKGVFRGTNDAGNNHGLQTDTSSLTVLGGRGVDVDNSAHGNGVLTIISLGRISEATSTTTAQGTIETPETDKPVGGVRIKSKNINLLSLDNRSTNSYQFDGTKTNGIFQTPQQDLVLIADNIDFLPGTIQTKAETFVQLRPTDNRNIQVAFAQQAIPNTTVYTGGFAGLLNQFNPDSRLLIGGSDYAGNINIGSSSNIAEQISLGDMTIFFETAGRVFNNYAANPDTPFSWNDGTFVTSPYSPSPAFLCVEGQACLGKLTTSKIFIKDSLKQGNPNDNRFRDIVIQGTGSGIGGSAPTTAGGGNNSGGGNGNGNSGGGGGGGGGSNNNDSGPGGVNEPSSGPSGGGNTGNPTPGDGTTAATNNPGQGTGNPGGNPGNTADPTTPGNGTNTGTPQDGNTPTGDTLAGGGQFSGNDNSGNTNPGNGNNNQNNNNGGNTSNNNNNPNTNNPSGGGTLSDGSTPGNTDPNGGNTQVAGDPNDNGGFTGGGNNGNTNNNSNSGNNGSGGGTLSDGSTPGGSTGGGTQVAGDPNDNGGFTGGGSSNNNNSNSGTTGNTGGGTFSDGSGSTPGGTQVADSSTGGSGNGSGGFTGGGAGTGSPGDGGNSGGGTFSDGSGSSPGGSQVAGGSQGSGQSGNGQSGSSSSQGSGTQAGTDGGFAGGGAGSSGSQTADNTSGGFTGGGSGSTTASSSGSGGGSGGATFSDGSGSSGGTMLADNTEGAGNQGSGGQGSGSQGTAGQSDSGGFSGGGSGTAAGESGSNASQTQTASSGDATAGDNAMADGDSVFNGGASGGGAGDATLLAANTEEQTQDYPECGDEGQSVKQVSRAGQPNADMIQMKATGVRLRGDKGSLNQQRASCTRSTASN